MRNTEILNKINTLLNIRVKLEQMTLDNGTVVEAESFTAGKPIFSIDGDNKNPLEVGTYTMEDGMILEVYEIGKIGEVAMPSAEVEEVEAGYENKEEKEVAMAEVPATLEEILQAVVDAIQPKLDELQAKIDAVSGGQVEMKETLSSQKARKPLTHKPTEKAEVKTTSHDPQALIFAKLANIKR